MPDASMIRVEIGSRIEVGHSNIIDGMFDWGVNCAGLLLRGRSRNPLQDACNSLHNHGLPDDLLVGLYRGGSPQWDICCSIGNARQLRGKSGGKVLKPRRSSIVGMTELDEI